MNEYKNIIIQLEDMKSANSHIANLLKDPIKAFSEDELIDYKNALANLINGMKGNLDIINSLLEPQNKYVI